MNIWWFVFPVASFAWGMPMAAMHKINAPFWAFILFALFWGVISVFAEPMYDWGTNFGRVLGHYKIVALRERFKPKLLPPVRVSLVIMAIISLVFSII